MARLRASGRGNALLRSLLPSVLRAHTYKCVVTCCTYGGRACSRFLRRASYAQAHARRRPAGATRRVHAECVFPRRAICGAVVCAWSDSMSLCICSHASTCFHVLINTVSRSYFRALVHDSATYVAGIVVVCGCLRFFLFQFVRRYAAEQLSPLLVFLSDTRRSS
jgi:hypothetical protein